MKPQIVGIMPALITPFNKNNNINFKEFEKLMTQLRDAGASGWVPCGSTGEYYSMDSDERSEVLKFVKDFANKNETLIAGTNASTTREVM